MLAAFVRNRATRVVALTLVTLILSPLAGADDYAFLHSGPADTMRPAAQISLGNPLDLNEESDDSHDVCSCSVCTVALGESFSPRLSNPQSGELVTSTSVRARYASHLPDIYKPPIA